MGGVVEAALSNGGVLMALQSAAAKLVPSHMETSSSIRVYE